MNRRLRILVWSLALAVKNICGFETGNSDELFSFAGTASIQSATTRGAWSDYALRANPSGLGATGYAGLGVHNSFGDQVNGASATAFCRFYFRYATKPSSGDEEIFASLDSSGSYKFSVRIDSNGKLVAYASSGAGTTGSTVLAANTWYRIEVKIGTGASAAWEVKIDGVSELSGTGDLLSNNNGQMILGLRTNRNANTVDFYFDDWSWDDAAYPGDGRVSSAFPNANGNYQTWTIGAGAGSHYQQVDEVSNDGDTTYLLSPSVLDNAETEALEDAAAAGVSGTIYAVKSFAVVKTDGFPSACRLRLRSGSTDDDTTSTNVPGTSYALIAKLYATDPATSAAWTTGGIDGIEVGCVEKGGGGTPKTRMTQCGAMIDWAPALAGPRPRPHVAQREVHYAEIYE